MTQKETKSQTPVSDNWAGAAKEFFRQFGSVATLLILVLTVGQCTDCVDVYRLLGR